MECFPGEEEAEGAVGGISLMDEEQEVRSPQPKGKVSAIRRFASRVERTIRTVFRGREFSNYRSAHFGRSE